ncbi:DMT family transporter [Lichenibacterium ramalinae]|uniref:DMT family transporter n=1 Tax=Lichenibacterium ramalinae TaxID=2316527 RepID=A0A4Q2R8T1_9HYPH|nr:DMT family transporter [Lichenibacterium ramalinae]RYB03276.1 DMT family transporter [Lichenibacterium ramalinae]
MIYLYAFALVAGIANAFQAGANSTLSKTLNQPFLAALMIVGVSALTLAAAGLISGRLAWPTSAAFAAVPWWAWGGGLLSALLLMSQLFVAEAIGAGPFLGIIVVAGTLASLLIDNYGLVGFKLHPLNAWRIVGGALMGAGVLLVALF